MWEGLARTGSQEPRLRQERMGRATDPDPENVDSTGMSHMTRNDLSC